MLLPSITKHVKNQTWIAILIDLFILLVEVFAGIRVSNWTISRTDKSRAAGYLEGVAQNLTIKAIS